MNYVELQEDLDKALIGPQQLLSGTKVLTESSRESPEYLDRRNFPLWFHLGKQLLGINRVMQVGPKLGLVAACFLRSCPVAQWMMIGDSHRMTTSNIRLHSPQTEMYFYLRHENLSLSFELGLLTEEYDMDSVKKYLNFLWDNLEPEGLLVVDYINSGAQGEAFHDFAGVKNRESVTFKTRYGVGIIEK